MASRVPRRGMVTFVGYARRRSNASARPGGDGARGAPALVSLFAPVPLERLHQQASLARPVLEEVNDADGGIGALDAGLDQREIPGVAESELIEPLGLGPADIARGGAARRIGILMMSNQRLPVFVSRQLDGFPDLLPGVGHVSPLAASQRLTRHCGRA